MMMTEDNNDDNNNHNNDNDDDKEHSSPAAAPLTTLLDRPVGSLTEPDISRLRQALLQSSDDSDSPPNHNNNDHNNNVATGTLAAQQALLMERILYRLIDEYQQHELAKNVSTDASSRVPPSMPEFVAVVQQWEAALFGAPTKPKETNRPSPSSVGTTTTSTSTSTTSSSSSSSSSTYSNQSINIQVLPSAVQHTWELYQEQQALYQQIRRMMQPPPQNVDSETFLEEEKNYHHPVSAATTLFLESSLRILAASRERGMDKRVWSILERVVSEAKEEEEGAGAGGDDYVRPTANMYASVIASLAKSRQEGAAARAENVLRTAVKLFPPKVVEEIGGQAITQRTGMTIDSFNVVLTAWAKSGLEYGPERAEALIMFMDQLDRASDYPGQTIRPSVSSFTSLIDAYAQQNEWEGCGNAERILNRMVDSHLQGEPAIEPNVASWTIVISAWARLSKKNNKKAADRADRLLKRMEALYDEGRISFGPDAIVLVTCMNAFAFSKTSEGPQKAEEILDEMNERYMDGDDSMKPSARSICMVIDAWIKSSHADAMERAEQVLDRYEDHLETLLASQEDAPNVLDAVADIYRSMLFGWSQRGNPIQAQEYLFDMVDKNMKPDCFCFDKVIESNMQAGLEGDEDAFERVKKVFALLESCRKRGIVKPNERVYTSFIRAMARARVDNLAARSIAVLRRMQELSQVDDNQGIAPTVFTYNAVLMACAESGDVPSPDRTDAASCQASSLDAFKVAAKTFNELRNIQEGPDHVSFSHMIRCANLLPAGDQKDAFIQSTFALCCKAGFVNSYVIRDLQHSASEDLWRSLLDCPEGMYDFARIPSQWSFRFNKEPARPQRPQFSKRRY